MDHPEEVEIYPLNSAQISDPGMKRVKNEDWAAGFEPTNPLEIQVSGSLYIVADGVGGATKGERASQYAAERVLFEFFQETEVEPAQRLHRAMKSVCKEIYEYAQDTNLSRMATTLVAANIRKNILTVANVGDSRCYLLRSGKAVQITEDHNLAAEFVRNGSYTAEEAKHIKSGNTLLRSIGGDPEVEVDVFGDISLFPGDVVVLCSDGLARYLENETLVQLCSEGSAETISRRLINYANNCGGADNVTVYIIKVGEYTLIRDVDEDKTIPAPITLDESKDNKSTRKRTHHTEKTNRNYSKFMNIGLSILLVLILVFGLYYLLNKKKVTNVNETPEIIPTDTIKPQVILPIAESTIQATSSIVIPTDQSEYVQPTNQDDLIVTISPTLVETQTPDETQIFSDNKEYCVYEIQEGETLITILERFGLNYHPTNEYFYFESCDLKQRICSKQKVEISEPNDIGVLRILMVPEVMTIEECESVENSTWITINP